MIEFARSHLRLSPSAIIAVTALVFAMTGGAWAVSRPAAHESKAKSGRRGPRGATGPAGARGPKGDPGAKGDDGSGSYPTSLPAGHTETGAFAIRFAATAAGQSAESEISFPIPLASNPVIGATADCTGSVGAPSAATGTFCIYPGQGPTPTINASNLVTPSGTPGMSRFGGALTVQSGGAGDALYAGTWAVTAP